MSLKQTAHPDFKKNLIDETIANFLRKNDPEHQKFKALGKYFKSRINIKEKNCGAMVVPTSEKIKNNASFLNTSKSVSKQIDMLTLLMFENPNIPNEIPGFLRSYKNRADFNMCMFGGYNPNIELLVSDINSNEYDKREILEILNQFQIEAALNMPMGFMSLSSVLLAQYTCNEIYKQYIPSLFSRAEKLHDLSVNIYQSKDELVENNSKKIPLYLRNSLENIVGYDEEYAIKLNSVVNNFELSDLVSTDKNLAHDIYDKVSSMTENEMGE